MKEYIEREKALDITKRTSGDYATAFSMIRQLPAADVAPVVHGRWKLLDSGNGTCSECHFTQKNVWDYDGWQSYCGVCGAKMDGGQTE